MALIESKVQKVENWYGKDGKELSYVYRLTIVDDARNEAFQQDLDHDPTDIEIAGLYKLWLDTTPIKPGIVEERIIDTSAIEAAVAVIKESK